MDAYDIRTLEDYVREKTGKDLRVVYLEETASTNVWAADHAGEYEAGSAPVLVIADSQTAGRGRLGHTWQAKPGEGISMSLMLDPCMDMKRVPQITLAAGIAVRRALKDAAGIEAYVKWPNDILIKTAQAGGNEDGADKGFRKICGILCAMARGKVICGIGINVHNLHFPEEIACKASSVDLISGRYNNRTKIAAAVMSELLMALDVLRNEGWTGLKDEYDKYCVNREGRILLTDHVNPSGKKTGNAYGTDEEGRLRVVWDSGVSELLDAGEIELI